jgi:hypothetical protein
MSRRRVKFTIEIERSIEEFEDTELNKRRALIEAHNLESQINSFGKLFSFEPYGTSHTIVVKITQIPKQEEIVLWEKS